VSPAKEIILQGKIATLLHLQERLDEMTKLLLVIISVLLLTGLVLKRTGSGDYG
jgi:hypothetical protein